MRVRALSVSPEERAAQAAMRNGISQWTIWPLSISFALSVSTGNLALKYLFPSFNQMLASIGPLVTIMLDVFVTGTKYNFMSYFSVGLCVVGVMMCTLGEPSMNVWGLFFNLTSTFLRGLKSVLQQTLLQDHKIDSVTLLFFMAPQAALVLLPTTLFMEGTSAWINFMNFDHKFEAAMFWLVIASCLNACFLNITTFIVTRETSAVTLQVLGNAKTLVGIAISFAWFGNATTNMQLSGIAVCIMGIVCYERLGKKFKTAKQNPLLRMEMEIQERQKKTAGY
jgi:drug/metabolite transporter (DMT)-like permease